MIIDITERKEKCFADLRGTESLIPCDALNEQECNKCKFYKPVGCKDWVKLIEDGREILYAPEETTLIERSKYEQTLQK